MTQTAFAPRQIVYLACEQTRLYAEVIQVLVDRPRCWVRPLLLTTPDQVVYLNASIALGQPDPYIPWISSKIPDLLWPIEQFCPALDTEFLSLITTPPAPQSRTQAIALNATLNQFMKQLWQATTTISDSTCSTNHQPDAHTHDSFSQSG